MKCDPDDLASNMTTRQRFAMAAMEGLCANASAQIPSSAYAKSTVGESGSSITNKTADQLTRKADDWLRVNNASKHIESIL